MYLNSVPEPLLDGTFRESEPEYWRAFLRPLTEGGSVLFGNAAVYPFDGDLPIHFGESIDFSVMSEGVAEFCEVLKPGLNR